MFEEIAEEITRKFREIKLWLSNIDTEKAYATIDMGLFFVYIYGVYEETVRKVVSNTILELNNEHIPIDKCIFDLYSLIFSKEYDGIYNVGNDHKWEKRWDIAEKLRENLEVKLPNELFPTDGKNIRYRQLESLAKSFGLKDNILPRTEVGGYIEEMVNNRNYIAHGNKLPREVGRGYTLEELTLRCEIISEVCNYIVERYSSYIVEKKFLKERVAN
mgnify:CR=1 FL=1